MAHRKRRGRRRSALPWIVAVLVFVAALWALLANVVLVVRDVQVVGVGEEDSARVRRMSGIRLGARMLGLDEERVRLEVESDGRMAFVSLEKRLPGRVVLTVRPRTRDALIIQGGHILLLDTQAYVVEVTDSLPDGEIVYVTGMRASNYSLGHQLDMADGRCAAMGAVVDALKRQGAVRFVSELDVSNTADLRIMTRSGVTVSLGDAANADAKVAWMAGALSDLEARGERGGELDVSSGTKADYRPAPTPEPQAQTPAGEADSGDVHES